MKDVVGTEFNERATVSSTFVRQGVQKTSSAARGSFRKRTQSPKNSRNGNVSYGTTSLARSFAPVRHHKARLEGRHFEPVIGNSNALGADGLICDPRINIRCRNNSISKLSTLPSDTSASPIRHELVASTLEIKNCCSRMKQCDPFVKPATYLNCDDGQPRRSRSNLYVSTGADLTAALRHSIMVICLRSLTSKRWLNSVKYLWTRTRNAACFVDR
jgi:hypothetical protein